MLLRSVTHEKIKFYVVFKGIEIVNLLYCLQKAELKMHYYFAYGSNLHPVRILDRVPSAKLIGATNISKHGLTFHKVGLDGSGKCSLIETGDAEDLVYGAIYVIDAQHKVILDEFESLGKGYIDREITIKHNNNSYRCFTYFAQREFIDSSLMPYHWYKKLVVLGAEYLKLPKHYVESIQLIDSIEDPEHRRKKEHEKLIKRVEKHR